jgi:hypothetical protein
MSNYPPLTPREREDLVAYLDGELTGEPARALEAKLSLNPEARAEAEALRRTWDLLDYLPRPEPSASFMEKTLSRALPVWSGPGKKSSEDTGRPWRIAGFGVGWAAALALAAWGGYAGSNRLGRKPPAPRGPGESELVRDLRLIENKRYYDLVEDLDFLRALDHPDLFGDEPGS